MARRRIVVAGAGAMGASIAYHLALLGADDVVLCDVGEVASGATGKAMGGVRQQFSTAAEVRLAQASIGFFRELGAPFFHQVGYLFLATTEDGLARLRARAELQRGLGVPVEDVDAAEVARPAHRRRARRGDLPRGRRRRARPRPRASSSAAPPSAGWRCASTPTRARSTATCSSSRAAGGRAELLSPSCRSVRSCASSSTSARSTACRRRCRWSSRRRRRSTSAGATRACASRMREPTRALVERRGRRRGARRGRARASRAPLSAGRGRAGRARVGGPLRHDAGRASDHRPDRRRRLRRRRASAATASCSRRRSGARSPRSCSALEPTFDLTPYRLERFAGDEVFPEELVL